MSSRIVAYSHPRRARVLGCMSGTSVDGIDVACVDLELDGEELGCQYRGVLSVPLGRAYAEAFAAAAGQLADGQADFAVLHGQTFYHWVDDAGRALGTLQLGSSAAVAERLGLPVICDLRSRDVAAGGQGAPLVSMFDLLLLAGREKGWSPARPPRSTSAASPT